MQSTSKLSDSRPHDRISKFTCLLLASMTLLSCKDNASSSQEPPIQSSTTQTDLASLENQWSETEVSDSEVYENLSREFELLDLQIDNFFRDENRYFEEIYFWTQLIFIPTESEEDILVALNSAPERVASTFYDMRLQANRVNRLLASLGYVENKEEGKISKALVAGLKVKEYTEKASNVLNIDTPFSGSNVIDLQSTLDSEAYADFLAEFSGSMLTFGLNLEPEEEENPAE